MIDERELENKIERVPAAPDSLIVLRSYAVQPGSQAIFESQWQAFAATQAEQDGCLFLRLHHDTEKTSRYVAYELWKSRRALIHAIQQITANPAYPLAGETRDVYVRLSKHVAGSVRDTAQARPGQVVTLRHFYLKVNSEPQFERLWSQSAQAEAKRALYKRLHRDLNLPTHYVSYSLWASTHDANEAAHDHPHWQTDHEPYPLSSPVARETLEVRMQAKS